MSRQETITIEMNMKEAVREINKLKTTVNELTRAIEAMTRALKKANVEMQDTNAIANMHDVELRDSQG